MKKEEIAQTVQTMIQASSCCEELKNAGRKWLDAIGTAGEHAAAEALLQEIREDVATIDHVIEFFESPQGKRIFGEERAKAIASHAHDVKAAGGKWCDCPACAAGLTVLENAAAIL